MTDFLTKDLQDAMEAARRAAQRRSARLCVHDGEEVHPVLRMWETGFALAAKDAPILHGFVDLYDGPRHLYQCLVMTSRVEEGERVYEFKRHSRVSEKPPVDFEREEAEPALRLPRL
ncbi:hypothetical protein FHS00_000734 [Limimaricola variabilis]|jgi:hypothetical protein|uniref:DUF1653 domain-containing protein n=1 Tax=Limimaricola variabilis TaxID=1492771 RepID=A0ABR6HKU8_9RHOB|nr:hypothetical protein [Limimaricola variabilis]MBB3711172.1 hypothetical protein [Limimaricola variabilis]WPY93844.1 hypothetical protein T8T21_12080 [Limimaricola variabilis]